LEGDGDETDVSQGQIEEEEVHGSMEDVVRADSQDDEKFLKHNDEVCTEIVQR
jgi:hypothetical protein